MAKKREKKGCKNMFFELVIRARDVIVEPNKFFARIKADNSIQTHLAYFFIVGIIVMGLWRVPLLLFKISLKYPGMGEIFGISSPLAMWLIWIPMRVIGIFAMAYLISLCARIFVKKKHNFVDGLKVIAYGETPYALLGWVFTPAFALWAIVLYAIGINKIYDISAPKSVCTLVLATLLGVALIVVCSVLFGTLFIR